MTTTPNGIGKITAEILFVESAFRSEIVLVARDTGELCEDCGRESGRGREEVKERVVDGGTVGGEVEKESRPCGEVDFDFCERGGGCLG
jgi:hypothetical protein